MKHKRLWAMAFGLLLVGCSDLIVDVGHPLTIELTASSTGASVGQEMEFTFAARGTSLTGVILTYGDGVADSVLTSGAQTAGARVPHAFSDAGSYVVVGTVQDAVLGTASDEVTVQITAAAGSLETKKVH